LPVQELVIAVSINEGAEALDLDGIPTKEVLVNICAGLVTVENSWTIRLTHYTTKEYLDRRSGIPIHLQPSSGYHVIVCATYLMFNETKSLPTYDESICGCGDGYGKRSFLKYAALYVSEHLNASEESNTTDIIMKFVKDTASDLPLYSISAYAEYSLRGVRREYFLPSSGWHPLHYAAFLGHTIVLNNLL
jgi:hypothetical protein